MGLSASQAKLLSITARLSDNELRSQTITSAKMALANRTTEASREYIDALNATNLIYSTYDLNGNKSYVDLTGTQLSQYAPLKNQYGLINNKGQILVSELDADNYENSTTINEFLEKYGVKAIDTGEVETIENPEYKTEYEKWQKEYEEWQKGKPDATNEKYWTEVSGTDSELYNIFKEASSSCFNAATGGTSRCYLHVLAHMIDLETTGNGTADESKYPKYKDTTTGKQIEIIASASSSKGINYSAISGSKLSNGERATEAMLKVSDAIRDGWNGETVYAAEHPSENLDASAKESDKLISDYYLKEALENGTTPTEVQQLLSNYCYTYDADGNITGIEQKTLYQKCIDLYYAVDHSGDLGIDYNTVLVDMIKTFQEDMSLAFTKNVFDSDLYEKDLSDWEAQEPQMKDVPYTIDKPIYEYDDKDKAQWYVNLWHRMNGPSDEKDGTQTNTTIDTTLDENGNIVVNKTDTTSMRYDILEDGLMNSAEWLKYSLESGSITLERVNYQNPTEEGTGLQDGAWTSIIYTNALDISSETDEAAIAKAEAEYEAKTKDIESKDKQYDSMLKLLDTEHSALQTEYDSVKSVISKNMERTLKMYSA